MTTVAQNWQEANQHYLIAALAQVRSVLTSYVEQTGTTLPAAPVPDPPDPQETLEALAAAMPAPPLLDMLCTTFDLSVFERAVLLLCAGLELDASFAPLCAAAQADPQRPYPTLSLALAALPNPHWSAGTPGAPLRRWQLLELGEGPMLTLRPLRINERILHYLVGVPHLDERLLDFIEPLADWGELVPSHWTLAESLVAIWEHSEQGASRSVLQLYGSDTASKRAVAAATCGLFGVNLMVLPAHVIPSDPAACTALQRLWEREALLSNSALLLDCDDLDGAEPQRESLVSRFVDQAGDLVLVTSRQRWAPRHRTIIHVEVEKPAPAEQRRLWQQLLGASAARLNGQTERLVAEFHLNTLAIRAAYTGAQGRLARAGEHPAPPAGQAESASTLGQILWDACRQQARPHLAELAQRIEPVATWDDLVLPEQQLLLLRAIAVHVRQRSQVYDTWGFATKSTRGLGISALFTGSSGTGKTMAAEVLAAALQLDVYRIDLSTVVSKYIGETEKNLRRVFDAAEAGGVILLFDEADALFGKRSEVKDSHDRYANIEVSYLLQRMEAYRGLAILTTNLKDALDKAFLRRIRFVIQFPFPDATQRAAIWRRIFPAATPTEDLDITKLARLTIAGGNIRNIALHAAFLAAEAGEPVRMSHLLQATRHEYAKLEKPLSHAEIGDWSAS